MSQHAGVDWQGGLSRQSRFFVGRGALGIRPALPSTIRECRGYSISLWPTKTQSVILFLLPMRRWLELCMGFTTDSRLCVRTNQRSTALVGIG